MEAVIMTTRIPRRCHVMLAAGALAAGLAAAGCGSSTPTTSAPAVTGFKLPAEDSAVHALLPAAIKKSGTVVIATDASYAPMEFIAANGHTIIGADADLSYALGAVMGVHVNLVNVPFDSIIPGLAANRYTFSLSGFGETLPREEVVNFVSYAKAGQLLYVLAHGGPNISGLSQMCGQSLAVEAATVEQTEAQVQSSACTRAHKPGSVIHSYVTQTAANLAVLSGRATVGFADSPVTEYLVRQSDGKFRIAGTGVILFASVYAAAVPKADTALANAILAGVKAVMADGTYARIYKKWGLQSLEINNPMINGKQNLIPSSP
jgi:polar amino acid transport system substrate-binding protein